MRKYKVSCGKWLKGEVEATSELDAIQRLCIEKGLDPYVAPIDDFDVKKLKN